MAEEKLPPGLHPTSTALVPVDSSAVALPLDQNPLLVYLGGLDRGSRPTMLSTAGMIARTLSGGRVTSPEAFPWHQVRYQHVKRLVQMLREQDEAPKRVNKVLVILRRVAEEAWSLGLLSGEDRDRIKAVKSLPIDDLPGGRVLDRSEIKKLLEACSKEASGARDAAAIALLAGAGLRRKEAVRVLAKDYDAETGDLAVLHGKGRRQRATHVAPWAREFMWAWLQMRSWPEDEPVLIALDLGTKERRPIAEQAIDSLLRRRAKLAGITKPFTAHDLRRSFITHMLEDGMDPLLLARIVGHKNPKTTMLYDRRTNAQSRAAVGKSTLE
jgi:integrase